MPSKQSLKQRLQGLHQQKLGEDFIGRADELSRFEHNLDPTNEKPALVFNISGQGGMGKTYLLKRFRQMAEARDALTASTDEAQQNVVEAMARLAEELQKQDVPLKSFTKRLQRYEQRRRELLSLPSAPKELPAFLNRTVRAGIKLARHAPALGPMFEILDEEAISSAMGSAAEFIANTLKSDRDDIQLLQEPIKTLTPLFLEGLFKLPESQLLVLFFDTYENTSSHLDSWLRALLDEEYGQVHPNLLLGIAGRAELAREDWAAYEGFIARISLNPFTREEVRNYLSQHGITQDALLEEIYSQTQGLPVEVAFMASAKPGESQPNTSSNETVVQRFLKWTEDPLQRQLATDAALPRWFNKDTLVALLKLEDVTPLFTWLKDMPFVHGRSNEGGWEYHPLVRRKMLLHVQQESPAHWKDIHERLSTHYEGLREGLQLAEGARQRDERWRRHSLEALYHRLCAGQGPAHDAALNGFVSALKTERSFARDWAETLKQAEEDSAHPPDRRCGARLLEGLKAIEEERYLDATGAFTLLLELGGLEPRWQAAALDWRGYLFRRAEKLDEAVRDTAAAVALVPGETEYLTDHALSLLGNQRHAEAISLLTRLLESSTAQVRPQLLSLRGLAHQFSGDLRQAVEDFTGALALSPPEPAFLHMQRAQLYIRLGEHGRAVADMEQAGQLEPQQGIYCMVGMGIFTIAGDWERAGSAAKQLLLRAEDIARELATYAPGRQRAPPEQEDLRQFYQAAGEDPDVAIPQLDELFAASARNVQEGARLLRAHAHLCIAENLRGRKQPREALATIDEAVRLAPTNPSIWANRSRICSEAGMPEEELVSIDRLEDLRPDLRPRLLNQRGLILSRLGRYGEAMDCFHQALEQSPGNEALLYNLAVAKCRKSGPEDAQEEIAMARAAFAEAAGATEPEERAKALYGLGGLDALTGEVDTALSRLHEAILADPDDVLDWARHDIAWRDLHNDLRFQLLLATSSSQTDNHEP